MTEPLMTRRGPDVDEAAIVAFEKRLGAKLPDDYRAFILTINGGRLAPENRRFAGRFVVNSMFSLDDPDEARRLVPSGGPDDAPSKELLRIAYDDGGNDIYIGISGTHRGEVWYWNVGDQRAEGSNPRVLWHDRRDVRVLARTFTEFLSRLGPLEQNQS